MSAHGDQLALAFDILAAPAKQPPTSTNGTEPPPRDSLDLSDLDLGHADRIRAAELAAAITNGCQGPRTCECDHVAIDVDELGDVRCVFCGHAPPERNGGPP